LHVPPVVNNPYDPATTSRDFVPWRFSDADRRSLWLLLTIGVGETCTKAFGVRVS
jgi:hypothetical protein